MKLYNESMFLRLLLLPVFVLVFAAGVTCAVVCPEQALDSGHDDNRECTDCISTHFVAASKTADEQFLDYSVQIAELPTEAFQMALHTKRTRLVAPKLFIKATDQSKTVVFRI